MVFKVQSQIRQSADFKRIDALLRREWSATALETVRVELTKRLAKPGTPFELRPIQAEMLIEAWSVGGLFAHVGVGHGKTLTSALIPTLVDCERPCILVPAKLKAKTEREIAEWSEHFEIRPDITVLKYSSLSSAKGPVELLGLEPDLIILDEAHLLKNIGAARTKRFNRYVEAFSPKVFAMSGTLIQGKLAAFCRIAQWALGEGSPLPHKLSVIKEWGAAADSRKAFEASCFAGEFRTRPSAGALTAWLDPEDKGLVDPARAKKAIWNRIRDTEGCVLTVEDSCDQPISLRLTENVGDMSIMDEHLARLRTHAEGPNGEEYTEQIQVWQIGRQLSMGYYLKWVPKPPESWYEARREYNAFCRRQIKARKADTPLQAAQRNPDHPAVLFWRHWQARVEYDVVPVWLTDTVVDYAVDWALRTGGLIWCEHVAVGERIGEKGIPYFGAGEVAAEGLKHHVGPCALSIPAHATGRNLQRYSHNLILSIAPSGSLIEQLAGRTHRQGQNMPVSFEFLAHTSQLRGSLATLDVDSQDQQEISQQPQKIQSADKKITQLLVDA